MTLINWFHSAFGVNKLSSKGELQTLCPKCKHEKFYFNLKKRVGWCHSAKCHWNPRLNDLIKVVGYGPDEQGYTPMYRHDEIVKISLPSGSYPIFSNKKGIDYLLSRNIPYELFYEFNIHCTNDTVIVPVTLNGEIVSYVQRNIDTKFYNYPSNGQHHKTLLGWDTAQYWDTITLVENTFVSLWLRDLQCTTNFGSHLSDHQALTIAKGSAKLVNILWDEGAKTNGAENKLRSLGIKTNVIKIKGQPDNYPKETIQNLIKE